MPPLVSPADRTRKADSPTVGVVRAPLLTTLMQVASRLLLVWGVVHPFPAVALSSPFYTSMLVAWSVTEFIRYSFFAFSLSGWQPRPLTWLRYNTFFVLYPMGISSECALIYLATEPAGNLDELYKWALYAILAIYVPGESAPKPEGRLGHRFADICCDRFVHAIHVHDEAAQEGYA